MSTSTILSFAFWEMSGCRNSMFMEMSPVGWAKARIREGTTNSGLRERAVPTRPWRLMKIKLADGRVGTAPRDFAHAARLCQAPLPTLPDHSWPGLLKDANTSQVHYPPISCAATPPEPRAEWRRRRRTASADSPTHRAVYHRNPADRPCVRPRPDRAGHRTARW